MPLPPSEYIGFEISHRCPNAEDVIADISSIYPNSEVVVILFVAWFSVVVRHVMYL